MLAYQLFPRSQGITSELNKVIECFNKIFDEINSNKYRLTSNEVLSKICPLLEEASFTVERGKSNDKKIDIPVLFGRNNKVDKAFYADAVSKDGKIVIEIEAGRAVVNNQFLKDIFQACMMQEVEYLVLAVRNLYHKNKDFEKISTFLETLYISNRLILPLKGILLIGY